MVFELFLVALSTIFSLLAIFFSYKLSKETGGEKYWVFFVIAAIGFAVSHIASKSQLLSLPLPLSFSLQEVGEIVGGFSFAYACYGLYTSMKRIRLKISEKLSE